MRHTMAYRHVSENWRQPPSASTTSRSSSPVTSRWSVSTDGSHRPRADHASAGHVQDRAVHPLETDEGSRTTRSTRSRRCRPTECSPCCRRSGRGRRHADVPSLLRHGSAAPDAMRISSRNRLACKTLIKDLNIEAGRGQAIRGLPLEKDPRRRHGAVLPGLPRRDALPHLRGATIRQRSACRPSRTEPSSTTPPKCILSACCTTSCPVFWSDGRYFQAAGHRRGARGSSSTPATPEHRRASGHPQLKGRCGVCRTTFNFTDACPRGIEVTKAIQEVKRADVPARLGAVASAGPAFVTFATGQFRRCDAVAGFPLPDGDNNGHKHPRGRASDDAPCSLVQRRCLVHVLEWAVGAEEDASPGPTSVTAWGGTVGGMT